MTVAAHLLQFERMEPKIHDILPNLVEHLLDAVVVVNPAGTIAYANAACESIFGYSPEELVGTEMIDHVVPEDRLRTQEEARLVMTGLHRIGFENRYIRKDGRYVHVMWSARWLHDHQLRIGVARDVTRIRHAERIQATTYAISEAVHDAGDLAELLQKVHGILAQLMPLSGFAVAVCNSQGGKPEVVYQAGMKLDLDTPQADEHCQTMALNTLGGSVGLLVLRRVPGVLQDEKDQDFLRFMAAQLATAVERMQLKAQTRYFALHDELTGLPNRRLLKELLTLALHQCRRHRQRLALVFLDVDGLKQVNDSLGHAAGDRFLQEFAHRLRQGRRQSDTVARLGGDEFLLLLPDIQKAEHVHAIVAGIHDALAAPLWLEDRRVAMGASTGIALYPEDGADAESLLQQADKAMYVQKTARRKRGGQS